MTRLLFDIETEVPDPLWVKLKTDDHPVLPKVREKLEQLWQIYHPYSDSNFRQEFATHIHQRFWEMFLVCHLLHCGKNVVAKPNQSSQGPDILVKEDGRSIWIEAVAPTAGLLAKPDTVPGLLLDDKAHDVPADQLLLRVLTALGQKKRAFFTYLKQDIVESDDLCIIALNGGDMKGFEIFEGEAYLQPAVYPRRTKTWGSQIWHWCEPYMVPKSNGAAVPGSVFVTSEYAGISGMIFSHSGVSTLVNREEIFNYFPNPNCPRPLPQQWIPWSQETVISEDSGELTMTTMKNGLEIARVLGPFPKTNGH